MAVSVFKTFSAGEVLTASDLNSSLTQITSNGEDLAWPATKAKDLNGLELTLDVDGDSGIVSDTDDRMDVKLGGTDLFRFDGTTASSVNGLDFKSSAANNDVVIIPQGSDTNIDLDIQSKGSGNVLTNGSIIATAEDANNVIATAVFL